MRIFIRWYWKGHSKSIDYLRSEHEKIVIAIATMSDNFKVGGENEMEFLAEV